MHPSGKTSVPQIPAAYTEPQLKHVYRNTINMDYGGGRFEKATEHLGKTCGCLNLVYDPHCRTPAHNVEVICWVQRDELVTVISCLNVLNILLDKKDRDEAIEAIKYLAQWHSNIKHLVFQVYTKDSTGKPTKSQLNKKAEWYWPTLLAEFCGWDSEIIGDKKNIIHFWRD